MPEQEKSSENAMYVVCRVCRTAEVELYFPGAKRPVQTDLPLSGYHEGSIGALWVFDDREKAHEYADGAQVLEISHVG